MSQANSDELTDTINRVITLANEIKDEGKAPEMISAALMSASGLYATYTVTGNTGGLTSSGVDKVVAKYREFLEHIQEVKKREHEQQQQQ